MSHVDRTIFDSTKLLDLARRGCYLEYDFFGLECSHHEVSLRFIPNSQACASLGRSLEWVSFPDMQGPLKGFQVSIKQLVFGLISLLPHLLSPTSCKTVAIDMPSDAQRVQYVKTLVEAGYAHRLMLAHDIHTNHRLVRSHSCFYLK